MTFQIFLCFFMNNCECNFFPLDYGLTYFSCELQDLGMLGKIWLPSGFHL
jgi:hypothetical protein